MSKKRHIKTKMKVRFKPKQWREVLRHADLYPRHTIQFDAIAYGGYMSAWDFEGYRAAQARGDDDFKALVKEWDGKRVGYLEKRLVHGYGTTIGFEDLLGSPVRRGWIERLVEMTNSARITGIFEYDYNDEKVELKVEERS